MTAEEILDLTEHELVSACEKIIKRIGIRGNHSIDYICRRVQDGKAMTEKQEENLFNWLIKHQ